MPPTSGCSASIWSRVCSNRYGAEEPLHRAQWGHLPPQQPIANRAAILEYPPVAASTAKIPGMGLFR